MKYTVKFKDGSEPIKDLSFDDAFSYKMEHIAASSTFDIIEQIKPAAQEKQTRVKQKTTLSPEEYERQRTEYISTLKPWQLDDIKDGVKVLKHSDGVGFWLSTPTTKKIEETTGFSIAEAQYWREFKVKEVIRDNALNLYNSYIETYPDETTEEDFKSLLFKVLNTKAAQDNDTETE